MRIIVVGSGVAGLYFAVKARERGHDVVVLTRDKGGGSSWRAQGGVAVPLDDDDDVAIHVKDTLVAGRGLTHGPTAWAYIKLGRYVIQDLASMGIRFNVVSREGGHSRARVLGIGDSVGRGLMEALRRVVDELGIDVVDGFSLGELVLDGRRVVGVRSVGEEYRGDVVVLATGGYAGIYGYRTNDNLGEGIEAAARVGALVRDMEFVQFHPTVAQVSGFLVSEAVRGEGAILVNSRGERFMVKYDPVNMELAPRDVVARAIYMEMRGGPVYLDARSIVDFPRRFPTVYSMLIKHGINPLEEPVPVAPAAHYTIGGVAVDALGRSSIRGLFAIGEASSTMFHGANRLASNSLLEALVQGYLAVRAAEAYYSSNTWGGPKPGDALLSMNCSGGKVELPIEELRRIMWDYVGIVRDGDGLRKALGLLTESQGPGVLVSMFTAKAALARRGSVGVHYRLDHPYPDGAYHITMRCLG
jgi:L-aspartate oxidase